MADVKRAYHRSIRGCYPDSLVHASAEDRVIAEDRTKRVNNANEVSSDPASRAAYDQARLKPQVVQSTIVPETRSSYYERPRTTTVPRASSFRYQRQIVLQPPNTAHASHSEWRTSAFPSHGKDNSFFSYA